MEGSAWPKASIDLGTMLSTHLARFDCERRKMFGADVWFANGNMFAGVFGDSIFLRLSDEDGLNIKKAIPGVGVFSPNGKMVMHEYSSIPRSSITDEIDLDSWLYKSYAFASTITPKKKKGKRS